MLSRFHAWQNFLWVQTGERRAAETQAGEGGDAGAAPRDPNATRSTRSHDQVGKSLPVSAPTGSPRQGAARRSVIYLSYEPHEAKSQLKPRV